jgi:hypothetical protein
MPFILSLSRSRSRTSAKKKGCLGVSGKLLLQKKQLAFVIIQGDEFPGVLLFQKLTDQFPAHCAAGAGDQYAFLLKVQLDFLV